MAALSATLFIPRRAPLHIVNMVKSILETAKSLLYFLINASSQFLSSLYFGFIFKIFFYLFFSIISRRELKKKTKKAKKPTRSLLVFIRRSGVIIIFYFFSFFPPPIILQGAFSWATKNRNVRVIHFSDRK